MARPSGTFHLPIGAIGYIGHQKKYTEIRDNLTSSAPNRIPHFEHGLDIPYFIGLRLETYCYFSTSSTVSVVINKRLSEAGTGPFIRFTTCRGTILTCGSENDGLGGMNRGCGKPCPTQLFLPTLLGPSSQ